jgi:hypothetical protein
MKNKILLLFFLAVFSGLQAQEIFNDCPREGSATSERLKNLNFRKNRYVLPTANDIDSGITMEALVKKGNDEDRFDESKAAVIEGYIFDITSGGSEGCNCKSKEEDYKDVHVVLVIKKTYKSKRHRVIAEITPRLRERVFEKLDIETSNKELRKLLIGKKVRVTGWLLFDDEHKDDAYNTDPNGTNNWRATCWEIHPITDIEIIDDN